MKKLLHHHYSKFIYRLRVPEGSCICDVLVNKRVMNFTRHICLVMNDHALKLILRINLVDADTRLFSNLSITSTVIFLQGL
ncbi:MAG: hypothetical protein HRT35_19835 [Algicola sp.]|nr:hypothetical protein [Algicola sp.]